jgi:calcium binding protein 39
LGIEAQLSAYFRERGPLISKLVLQAIRDPELAMHLGSILRACARSPLVVSGLLEQGLAEHLMELAACESFEAGSYAFAALRDLFEEASESRTQYLIANFHRFFRKYDHLLRSENYATCRQALAFLHTLLSSTAHGEGLVAAYVAEPVFLQTHMNLLRSDSCSIRLQALQVFKHFVLNPNKAAKVQAILHRNRTRLTNFLVSYSTGMSENAELHSMLSNVVCALHALVPPATSPRIM